MSVTFWCPEAPRKQVPCEFCADWLARGWIVEGERCDPFCTGTTEASEAPEVNMGNGNAAAILSLLGFVPECGGEVADLADLRRRIMRARNADRSYLVVEPSETPGGDAGVQIIEDGNVLRIQRMGARTISFGNTDEQTLRRLEALDRLAAWAQINHLQVTWG